MSKLIKTPLRYPGGKSRLADLLTDLMPGYFKEYREPFLGGGSVFLTAKQKYPDAKYWVNDLYYDLWCFWTASQTSMSDVADTVSYLRETYAENGKQLHEDLVSAMNDPENRLDVTWLAAAFFAMNRITFSGTSLSGGYSQESFDKRFTKSSIDRLKLIEPLLKDVNITNLDFEELIKAPGDDVFIFLDPPYWTATKSALYGKNGELHKGFDHERLAEDLKNCPHKWMMTYDNCDYIKDLYKDYNIIDHEFAYGMRNAVKGNDMTGKEILITNY